MFLSNKQVNQIVRNINISSGKLQGTKSSFIHKKYFYWNAHFCTISWMISTTHHKDKIYVIKPITCLKQFCSPSKKQIIHYTGRSFVIIGNNKQNVETYKMRNVAEIDSDMINLFLIFMFKETIISNNVVNLFYRSFSSN